MHDMAPILARPCRSLAETAGLAAALAPLLRDGDIVTLDGTLGAGKTAFARALIRRLAGSDTDVPSPTYNLLLTYDLPEERLLYHYDLYRLEQPADAYELDIEEAFDDGISLIEWAKNLGSLLPAGHLQIEIEMDGSLGPEGRRFTFRGNDSWRARLHPLTEAADG